MGSTTGSQSVSPRLLEIVRLYCSALNSCGFCVAMHSALSSSQGVSEAEIDALKRADPSQRFSARTLAALVLAKKMTGLDDSNELSHAVAEAKKHFDAQELSVICFQIAAINAWNRLAIADGLEAKHFKPSK
nr:carboxymuconolactone decarboxylase family protein [Sulfitobacter marinus]